MASYAAVASRGPKQTPEEVFAAPQLAEVEHTDDSSVQSLIDVDSGSISVVSSDFRDQDIKTTTQADRIDLEQAVAEEEEQARQLARQAREKAKRAAVKSEEYVGNPVYAGNAVLSTILAVVLGVNAYRKYRVGELTWKVVGVYAGALAAFGAVDFYATRFFNQKYKESKRN